MDSSHESYTEEFPAVPESVPRARTAITEFASAAGATGERLEAIRLAASEAITNAVLHAYRGGAGSFHVTASYIPDELWLLIGDDGVGLSRDGRPGGLGVGLVLIAALSDTFDIVKRSSGGTELQMRFRLSLSGSKQTSEPRSQRGAELSFA